MGDLKIAELLCSRLCHDLISPVGAVNAGIELLAEEDAGGMAEESLALVARSAGEAVRRLKFFRVAYGIGGGADSAMRLAEIFDLAAGLFTETKVALRWPEAQSKPPGPPMAKPMAKLALNMILLASEMLPRGGEIRVVAGSGRLMASAVGIGASVRDEQMAGLTPGVAVETLSARSVQAYLTDRLTQGLGGALQVAPQGDDLVEIVAAFPASR